MKIHFSKYVYDSGNSVVYIDDYNKLDPNISANYNGMYHFNVKGNCNEYWIDTMLYLDHNTILTSWLNKAIRLRREVILERLL